MLQQHLTYCLAALFCAPQIAQAHPHIFVDAELGVIFDADGQLEAVQIGWIYDEFYSMLLVSDMGLDPDFTGHVAEHERPDLDGFDMNWVDDYHGDTHASQQDAKLPLSRPISWTSDYRDGQLRSTHIRQFDTPIDARDTIIISVYDPTYYTSYRIIGTPQVTGREDCDLRIFEPDWDAAGVQLEAALDELLGAGIEIEADFPAVGALFADELRITCPAR